MLLPISQKWLEVCFLSLFVNFAAASGNGLLVWIPYLLTLNGQCCQSPWLHPHKGMCPPPLQLAMATEGQEGSGGPDGTLSHSITAGPKGQAGTL